MMKPVIKLAGKTCSASLRHPRLLAIIFNRPFLVLFRGRQLRWRHLARPISERHGGGQRWGQGKASIRSLVDMYLCYPWIPLVHAWVLVWTDFRPRNTEREARTDYNFTHRTLVCLPIWLFVFGMFMLLVMIILETLASWSATGLAGKVIAF